MSRVAKGAGAACGLVLLAACASTGEGAANHRGDPPPYSQVESETNDVLEQVLRLLPDPKEIAEKRSMDPYPCTDPLTGTTQRGAFFTGIWIISVPPGYDTAAFVHDVPQLLGDAWEVQTADIPLSFASVDLVRDAPRMSLEVSETKEDPQRIELLAISGCGLRDGD